MWRILVLWGIVSTSAYAARVSVSVEVRDEAGLPISNAVVSVSTQKKLMFGYGSRPDHFEWTSNVTDEAGMASIGFDCCTADFSCQASAQGYYGEKIGKGRFAAVENQDLTMRFLSVSTNLSFVLRRKICPIPMYSHGAMLNLRIPSWGNYIGYDLMRCDWVTPYGSGETADFEILFQREEAEGIVKRMGKMRFAQDGAGAYVSKKIVSDGLVSAHVADTNAVYGTEFESMICVDRRHPAESTVKDIISEEEYMVLRTRPKLDLEWNVISVNYSKIYGPIRIDKEFHFGQSSFNPTPNDPNLEYDVTRNLNRKSRNRTRP